MSRRPIVACLFVLTTLSAAVCASAYGPSLDISYGPERVAMERGDRYTTVQIDGTDELTTPGAPALPVRYLQFVIPADARVGDLSFTCIEQDMPGVHRVAPAQPEVPIGETQTWVDEDPAIYGSDELYPRERVEYLGDGYLGGYRIASVAVYPLQYAPRSGRLVLASDISVELELTAGANRAVPRARMTSGTADLYRRIVEGLVENPQDVAGKLSHVPVTDEIGDEGFSPHYTPSLEGSPVDYVIITSDDFAPYFQDLADWKTKKGVPAVVRTMSWINANYPGGVDSAERVRYFIKDAYESWGVSFVLLGGDTRTVPTRVAWSNYSGGWEVATDHYFADLDGNWDDDGDDLFGEGYWGIQSPGDSVDLYPDVFVGRAPTATVAEVETFIDKTLTYVKDPDPVFTDRDLFMGEVLFPYDWDPGQPVSLDGAYLIENNVMPWVTGNIHVERMYQNQDAFPETDALTRPAGLDSIDMGYNVVVHIGHGNKDILRMSKSNYVTVQDIDELANGQDRSGVFWMLNCSTTAIDADCISEHILNNPGGGGTFLFGPTRFCFPTTAAKLLYSWFELLYGGTEQAGVVCSQCKLPYVPDSEYDSTDRWTQMSFLLLGDPEARIWTDRPAELVALHDSTVPLGPTELMVTVLDPAPVDGALICVVKQGQVYARGYTNSSGQAVLSFTPKTTGTMTITVTARNHIPYEGTMGVTSSSSPHLTLRATTLDDDSVAPSNGNGNGHAESGETVQLGITAGNGGLTAATGVTATLSTTDPYATIIDSTESLGTINATSQVAFPGAFVVAIDNDCPNDYDIGLTVVFTTPARGTWTDTCTLRVLRPILTQLHNDYEDGNDDIPEVGDVVTLTVTVLNEGNGDAGSVTGLLRYPNGEVTVTDSTDTWGNIAAGESDEGAAGFRFRIDAEPTEEFELVLADGDGKTWTHSFDLEAPMHPFELDGRVQTTTVRLTWYPSTEPDLWGYNIYRTDHEYGTFSQVNTAVAEGIAYYEDAGLNENQTYYYCVTAVDFSGNESTPTDTLEISTNPPAMPGWPLIGGEAMYGSPVAVDVDLDGELEVLVGSGDIYCWHYTGVEVLDGDGDPRTDGVLAADGRGGYRSSVAVGELDGDMYPEIVAAAWGNVNPDGVATYEVWAWNAEDGTPLDGWPATTGKFCWATPNLADLDGDGLDEVIIPCANGYLYVWNEDGTGFLNADGKFKNLGQPWAYASAAVADIDGDDELEIVVPSRSDSVYALNPDGSAVDGWPVGLDGDVRTSIAIGDITGNGELEIVAGSLGDEVYIFTSDGDTLPNWPVTCVQEDDFGPSPTLADLDGDGDLEIMMNSSNAKIYVWTWEGDLFPGAWPVTIHDLPGSDKNSSISAGDVDGDPGIELVVGLSDGKVYAFDADGQSIPGWPIQLDGDIYSSPAIADLDLDGDNEVIVSGLDGWVYVWDTAGQYADGDGIEWGCYRHDSRRTGDYGYELQVGVDDSGEWVVSGAKLDQNFPNPFNPFTTIAYTIPGDGAEIELAVYNAAGAKVATLVSGKVQGGRSSVVWDGTDSGGQRVASGVYFVRLKAPETTLTRKVVLLK